MLLQSSQSFSALQTIEDVLVNNLLASNYRRRYAVTYAFTASATGLILTLKVGTVVVADSIVPSVQNRIPVMPDDYLGTFGVLPGDRILLRGVETSNNARTLFYAFRFRPV